MQHLLPTKPQFDTLSKPLFEANIWIYVQEIRGNEKNVNNTKLNLIGWEITSCIFEVVTNKTKDMVEVTRFISLSCAKVNICDQSPRFPFMRIWLKIDNKSH